MNRQTGIAIVTALLSDIAIAAVLIVVLSGPSVVVPDGDLDPTSVSAAVHDAALALFPAANPGTPPPASADGVGAFDPRAATWHLRTRGGEPTVFSFGTPGAVPLMGDWDGDGVDTIGSWDSVVGVVTISTPGGALDSEFTLNIEGDRFFTGDWTGDPRHVPSAYDDRSSPAREHDRRNRRVLPVGESSWIPVSEPIRRPRSPRRLDGVTMSQNCTVTSFEHRGSADELHT